MQEVDIYQELAGFAGVPIVQFPGDGDPSATAALPEDIENHAWRIAIRRRGEQIPFEELFARFLSRVDPSRVRALVIGDWHTEKQFGLDSAEVIDQVAAAAERFPALRSVFLGDIDPQCLEISWIRQSDVTPLLSAFPLLEELGVKGGDGLRLSPVTHQNLRWLSIRTGGLGAEVVRAVGASSFPALQTLELCLGDPEYGGTCHPRDLADILAGDRLPALRRLVLADADDADEIAALLAHAPIVAQLEELDLSLGTLGDTGVAALLAGQSLTHLKSLDLNYNFISEAVAHQLVEALPTVAVDIDPGDAEFVDWDEDEERQRYVAVAE